MKLEITIIWDNKAVSRSKFFSLLLISLLLIGFVTEANARTVGDLLEEIRSRKVKENTAIPKAQYRERRQRVNLRAIKPPRSNRFLKGREGDEGQLEDIVDQEIAELFKLTQKYSKSQNRGEIWLRLAERYVEKAQYVEFRAQNQYDEEILKWEKNKRQGRRPRLNSSASKEYNKKAIQLYQWFLRDFPNDSKVDQALFFLGYNYFELGDTKRGESYYKRLTSQYKKSPYVDESNFALGEFYFENNKWKEAKGYYARVARRKSSRLYAFSLYKLAWCEYRLGNPKRAVRLFEAVVKDSNRQQGQESIAGRREVNKIRLGQEALRDLVPIYAETGRYESARSYFSSLANTDEVDPYMERLAYLYADGGKREAARYLFKGLIANDPNAPKALEYQGEIVQVYRAGGERAIFKAELFEWISQYGVDSQWGRANSKDKKLLMEAQNSRERTLRNYVLESHKIAQDSKAPTAQKEAMDGYRLYLSTFTKADQTPDMHFYFAELLFDMEKYDEASVHYLWVADNAPKHKFHEDSVLNMLLALEKRLPPEEKLVAQMEEGGKKVPYTKAEKRFIKAGERYLKDYPKNEKATDVEFKIARMYYAHNEFELALKHFWKIIEKAPNSEYATYSANLILDTYNLMKDYDGLVKAGERLLKYPKLLEKGTGADIKDVVQRAEFKKAQDAESKKDFAGSAREYEIFIKKNPSSELVSTAMFNAAVNYERAGNLLKAIGLYGALLGRNDKPAKGSHQRAMRLRARLYEQTGQLERAAIEFERYYKAYSSDPLADESLYNAAAIWYGLKRWQRATTVYNRYFSKTNASNKVNALFKLGELNQKRRNLKSAYAYYKKFIESNPTDAQLAIQAHIRLARISKDLNWRNRTKEWNEKTVAVRRNYERKGIDFGRSEAAEAEFHLLEPLYAEYRSVSIPKSESRQAAAIQKKLGLLKSLSSKLEKVISYDDSDYVIAAVSLIGAANEHFVETVMNAPLPKGLSKEQIKEYRAQVEQQIASVPRDNAIKNYELAIRRSGELKAYNEWVNRAHDGLARLLPNKYKSMKETVVPMVVTDDLKISKNEKYSAISNALKLGDETALVRQAAEVLSKDPEDGKVLNALAVFYLKTNREDLARIYLGKALNTKVDKSAIYNNLGVAFMAEDRLGFALKEFQKSLAEDDDNPHASVNLGTILLQHQSFKEAETFLDQGDDEYGKNAAFLNNMAIAQKYLGSRRKAKSNYEKAIDQESSNVQLQMNYARLMADSYDDKKEAIKILNKLKFIGGSTQVVKEANELLRTLQN